MYFKSWKTEHNQNSGCHIYTMPVAAISSCQFLVFFLKGNTNWAEKKFSGGRL